MEQFRRRRRTLGSRRRKLESTPPSRGKKRRCSFVFVGTATARRAAIWRTVWIQRLLPSAPIFWRTSPNSFIVKREFGSSAATTAHRQLGKCVYHIHCYSCIFISSKEHATFYFCAILASTTE
jgi:hypothetical protein